MPAETVMAEGVRRDPAPDRIRAYLVHRLVENLHGNAFSGGVENLAQDLDVDVPLEGEGDVGSGKRRDPGIMGRDSAFGHRAELREIDVGVGVEKTQHELLGGDIALAARVVLHVSGRPLLIERQIL